jgi:hypothetical protein
MSILNKFIGSWVGNGVTTTLMNNKDINVEHNGEKFFKIELVTSAPNTYLILLIEKGFESTSLGYVIDDILYSVDNDKFEFDNNVLFHNYSDKKINTTLVSNSILHRVD